MPSKQALLIQEKADLFRAIEILEIQKKEIEKKEAAMREELLRAMDEYNLLGLEVGRLDLTYIPATTRDSIDTKALKKEMPEIAEYYMKTTPVKASVRISLKKEKEEEA